MIYPTDMMIYPTDMMIYPIIIQPYWLVIYDCHQYGEESLVSENSQYAEVMI